MKSRLYPGFRMLFVLAVVMLLTQCRKDESITTVLESTEVMENEDVSFLIVVVDKEHQILTESSLMMAGDAQVYTPDDNGIYAISSVEISNLGRRITVSKEGYHTQVKMLTGQSASKNIEEVILIKKNEGVVISSGETGSIDGGGSLKLPVSLVTANGSLYNGPVKVESHYYDPDNAEYIQQGPGNMLGLTSEDEYVLLGSLGMYLIELSNPDTGEALNIPQGSTATISFPIAESQLGAITNSIPLWSMDEDLGVWIYEGEAKLDGDMMVAEVSHFSWWNCDLPYSFLPFCATFVDPDGDIVVGLEVAAYVNNQGFGNDVSDNSGMICGKLPKDQLIDFVLNNNNEQLDVVQIGPFVDLPIDITIEIPEILRVNGIALDCNQMPLTNGYGLATTSAETIPIYFDFDGAFSYTYANEDHTLLLLDLASNAAEVITMMSSTTSEDLGDVVVCDQLQEGIIEGRVMLDQDEDGVSDVPIEGVEVKLRNLLSQQVDYNLITDADGKYSIAAVPMIEYEIFVEETADRKVMYQGDNTPEDFLLNEVWSNKTLDGVGISVRLVDAMELDSDNDFQLVEKGMGEVRGRVMRDTDGDLIGDSGQEDVLVRIISFTQGTEKETTVMTDANGEYSVMMPNFIGEIKIDVGSVSDYDTSPDPDGDDSSFGSNSKIPIQLTNGEQDEDNEFVVALGKISGSVLEDIDGDGIGDVETFLQSGLIVDLIDSNLDVVRQTQLLQNGFYDFDNVLPGDYTLSIFLASFAGYLDSNSQDFSNDDEIDDADNVGIKDYKIPVRLLSSEHDADNNFVLEESSGQAITGNVSEDTDNDDVGDVPIAGVTITLDHLDPEFPISTVTDANGNYQFTNLQPGEYTITEQDESELDEDFVDVYDGDESPDDANDAVDALNDDVIEVTLSVGEIDADNNFVEEQLGSVSGNVSLDTNNDDVADSPIEGATITLLDVSGVILGITIADADGDYQFEDLAPGEFTITYTTPSGFVTVFDGDESPEDADDAVDALDDGRIEVTLMPGEDDADNNFVDRPE